MASPELETCCQRTEPPVLARAEKKQPADAWDTQNSCFSAFALINAGILTFAFPCFFPTHLCFELNMTKRYTRRQSANIKLCDDTRGLIVDVALCHFAQYGIAATTLCQIREASGQHNRSVINYHFTDKEGLLQAVVDHVACRLRPLVVRSLQHCSVLHEQRALTVENVVIQLGLPFSDLFCEDPEGRNCILFLSQLTHESDPKKLGWVTNILGDLIPGMLGFLEVLMPEVGSPKRIRILCLCLIQLIEVLSVSSRLEQEFFKSQPSGLALDGTNVQKLSMLFLSGGMAAAMG